MATDINHHSDHSLFNYLVGAVAAADDDIWNLRLPPGVSKTASRDGFKERD
jgi:hypothetical protein